jgi:archaellum biogenesis ATPase FlaH
MSFKDIMFGFASAEKERAQNPELLVNGFVDFDSAYSRIHSSDTYLILGYKGSGKTAIANRLQIEASTDPLVFCKNVFLGDFPFTPFSKIIRGVPEPEARFPTAWAWLLLLLVVDSLAADESLRHTEIDVWQKSVAALRQAGMLGSSDLTSLVMRTTKKGFRVGIPKVLEFESVTDLGSDVDIGVYVSALKKLIEQCQTANKHVVVIDGLDDIITKREVQFTSIGSLILETGRLNELFHVFGLDVKIAVLCRTDLFERTANANKNKVRQDYAVELDWYHDPNDPVGSMLVKIADTRASLSLKRHVDVFKEFLPPEIDHIPTVRYCLDMTRHTPRDFLQLLTHIQRFTQSGRVTIDQLKSGLRDYSIKYFLPELKDELNGYCSQSEIESFVRAISRLNKREFPFFEIISEMEQEGMSRAAAQALLESLFECSGLGNVSTRPSGKNYFTFKFRNRNSVFNAKDRLLLHRGVWKALNLM